MSFLLYCPRRKGGGTVDILCCLHSCPKRTVIQCKEYTDKFPLALNYKLPEKMVEKYKITDIPIPLKYWKRRRRGAL